VSYTENTNLPACEGDFGIKMMEGLGGASKLTRRHKISPGYSQNENCFSK